MFIKTLALAAAAAAVAPAVFAQSAGAPTAVETPDEFKSCTDKLGDDTHSLQDILLGQMAVNDGEDSVILPLVEAVTPETEATLTEFEVSEEGYTLLLPLNMDQMQILLSDTYDVNSTEFMEAADDIIRAHILPGTLSFARLQEETNATGLYTVESLQGFEWTFEWQTQGDDTDGGYLSIMDEWNVTTTGEIRIVPDVTVFADCPNTIIGVEGFMVSPDLLEDAVPPTAAPPPTGAPATPPAETPTEPVLTDSGGAAPEAAPSSAGSYSTGILAVLSAVGAAALSAALL